MCEQAVPAEMLVSAAASIRECLIVMDRDGVDVVFVVDDQGRAVGMVTWLGIRKALLGGIQLDDVVGDLPGG